MSRVRVIALGSEMGGDDAAALIAARALDAENVLAENVLAENELAENVLTENVLTEIVLAGRPGPSLIELFEPGVPIVLLDVVRRGAEPGRIVEMDLQDLLSAGTSSGRASSHDLGPVEALRLAEALGRPFPCGRFVGVGGKDFRPGAALSPEVQESLPALVAALRRALARVASSDRTP